MLLTVITGALAVSIFHLSFMWATIAVLIGNLAGGLFMALHSAQGPQLGVPQMVQTRGQFGSYGSVLVVALVVIMYIGFLASNWCWAVSHCTPSTHRFLRIPASGFCGTQHGGLCLRL